MLMRVTPGSALASSCGGGGEGEGLQKHGAALSAPGGVTGLSGAPLLGVLCPCFACLFCKNGVFVFMTNFQLTSWEP